MGGNRFRPACSVQSAADAEELVIVDVGVTNEGVDSALLQPLHHCDCEPYAVLPEMHLAKVF